MDEGKNINVNTARAEKGKATCGTVLSVKPLTVACETGALTLLEVVPEGSKPMEGSAWAAGRRLKAGDVLHQA